MFLIQSDGRLVELREQPYDSEGVEARTAAFEFIEGWYNSHRRHSALGYQSAINDERSHGSSAKSESDYLSTEAG